MLRCFKLYNMFKYILKQWKVFHVHADWLLKLWITFAIHLRATRMELGPGNVVIFSGIN